MKPFNLEEARNGAPVIARNGRDARIVCFDKKGYGELVVLLNAGDGEQVYSAYMDGTYHGEGIESPYDLFMKPTKKSGWVNIYPGTVVGNIYQSKEDAENNRGDYAIDTIKIEWEE